MRRWWKSATRPKTRQPRCCTCSWNPPVFFCPTLTLQAAHCNLRRKKNMTGEGLMKSLIVGLVALAALPALAQPGNDNGPSRTVWAAHKVPESPYTAPNKPVWHIADILKAHAGKASWDQQVML